MLDYEQIRFAVAQKHNVLIGKDDPILVTVTLTDMVLDHYTEKMEKAVEAVSRELAVSLEHHNVQAKELAGRIITDAADYVAKETSKAVAAAVSDATAKLRQDIADAQSLSRTAVISNSGAQLAKNGAYMAAILAGAAAVISVVALAVVLLK